MSSSDLVKIMKMCFVLLALMLYLRLFAVFSKEVLKVYLNTTSFSQLFPEHEREF